MKRVDAARSLEINTPSLFQSSGINISELSVWGVKFLSGFVAFAN